MPTSAFLAAPFLGWAGKADFTGFIKHAEKDLGMYAQDSITLFDSLHILLGARYDLADVRDGFSRGFGAFGPPPLSTKP